MKLILCPSCSDVVALRVGKIRQCECGSVGGRYLDSLHAEVWGADGFVLGFANGSLVKALRAQMRDGDLTELMDGIYEGEVKGRKFDAFIIPDSSTTVTRVEPSAARVKQEHDSGVRD